VERFQAWGFQYVSNIVWLKDKLGLGYWVRNRTSFADLPSRRHAHTLTH
jgi:N6-adenosine-specific RNA methylase IME4